MAERWAVEAIGLGKTYGRRAALRRVDLTVDWGERVAVYGGNGAGKSTLLRLLAGLLRPSKGEVLLGGVQPARSGELRRYVGYLGHQGALYPDLTVEENLAYYADLYRVAAPKARVAHLIERLALARHRTEPARALSRGLQQRLALARALVHDPPVLLLDEPDTGLDGLGRELLASLIDEPGRTIVFSSHHADVGRRSADRAVVLAAGLVVSDGPAADLDDARLLSLQGGGGEGGDGE